MLSTYPLLAASVEPLGVDRPVSWAAVMTLAEKLPDTSRSTTVPKTMSRSRWNLMPRGPMKRGKRNFVRKKKVCRFCVDKADFIDYKRAEILAPFIQERGKILPRRMTGTCARHQRWLTVAIKRAQNIALLPFAAEL